MEVEIVIHLPPLNPTCEGCPIYKASKVPDRLQMTYAPQFRSSGGQATPDLYPSPVTIDKTCKVRQEGGRCPLALQMKLIETGRFSEIGAEIVGHIRRELPELGGTQQIKIRVLPPPEWKEEMERISEGER